MNYLPFLVIKSLSFADELIWLIIIPENAE